MDLRKVKKAALNWEVLAGTFLTVFYTLLTLLFFHIFILVLNDNFPSEMRRVLFVVIGLATAGMLLLACFGARLTFEVFGKYMKA